MRPIQSGVVSTVAFPFQADHAHSLLTTQLKQYNQHLRPKQSVRLAFRAIRDLGLAAGLGLAALAAYQQNQQNQQRTSQPEMASPSPRDRHLDASFGREVVLCHQCSHEWYRDQSQSLVCPLCHSEAVEIVEPNNDPRDLLEFTGPSSFSNDRSRQRRPGTDSDPEEDDIDDHNHFPFPEPFGRQILNRGASTPGGQGDSDAILRRFADMLMNDFGGARSPRPGPDTLFPPRPQHDRFFAPFAPSGSSTGGPTTFRQTTFRSGPMSGTATFTIVSSNVPEGAAAPGLPPGFPSLFSHIISNASPASERDGRPAGNTDERPMPGGMGFANGLHELITALLNPQSAVHGDAVYTQEALDRIITNLMETNQSSNAAPPASQTAIERLEKKKLDEKMLGSEAKAECTICMDELNKGEEVTVLPCTHWFHGECVVLWLKEHNTCPICRASIEAQGNQSGSGTSDASGSGNNAQQPQASQPQQTSSQYSRSFFTSTTIPRPERSVHTPQHNEERLNMIRSVANDGITSAASSATRRNSLSPTNTRDPATRRVRSPSYSQDRETRGGQPSRNNSSSSGANNQGNGNTHGGPFSWLRDHLTRGSSSSSDRDRDRRR